MRLEALAEEMNELSEHRRGLDSAMRKGFNPLKKRVTKAKLELAVAELEEKEYEKLEIEKEVVQEQKLEILYDHSQSLAKQIKALNHTVEVQAKEFWTSYQSFQASSRSQTDAISNELNDLIKKISQ